MLTPLDFAPLSAEITIEIESGGFPADGEKLVVGGVAALFLRGWLRAPTEVELVFRGDQMVLSGGLIDALPNFETTRVGGGSISAVYRGQTKVNLLAIRPLRDRYSSLIDVGGTHVQCELPDHVFRRLSAATEEVTGANVLDFALLLDRDRLLFNEIMRDYPEKKRQLQQELSKNSVSKELGTVPTIVPLEEEIDILLGAMRACLR